MSYWDNVPPELPEFYYPIEVSEDTFPLELPVQAFDKDRDRLYYSVAGPDAHAFSIADRFIDNEYVGILNWTITPEYLNPNDTNHDSIYEVSKTICFISFVLRLW